ncbi:stereocilin [Stegastes partitus]|uniref:Stereocilin n=1 Tax=Stegastes partitus TaxID=144197 RepID=A0A9Y4KLJ0_9TELE|nr:PREDICTED: stereocilin-like [Stegastes partitus]
MAEKGSGMATLRFTSIIVCAVLLGQGAPEKTGGSKEDQREAILREIISRWSKGNGQNPQKPPPETDKEQSVHTWVRNIVGSLKTLGLLPAKSLPSLNKPIDRHRLSGFLYNISLYLQEMGAELEELPEEPDEEQLWEKVLHYFLQSEGSAAMNQWNGRVPPRPSVRVQDWFLSLRGSPHWDWLLGLLQSLITLSERQSHRNILSFLSQNWRTVSAVLEAALQALVSGTYGQASAGLQGFICALKGRNDCAFSVSWLQQLLQFLETRNWKPVVSLHPAGEAAEHNKGTGGYGRLKPFSLLPEAMRQDGSSGNASVDERMATEDEPDSMQSLLLQALSRSGGGERAGHLAQKNVALVQSLDGLRTGLLHRVGSSVYGNLRKKVSRVTMALLDDVSSLVEVPQPNPQGRCSVGENGSVDPAIAQMGLDLHATCSDAAWYLSAAEDDFLWVHVCSEFFAHEFNNTVCANSSFWLQRAHQAALTKDYHFFNQTSIDDLCVQLSDEATGSPGLSDNCLAQLGSRSLSAQAFRNCFLPNNSVLTSSLCGRDSSDSHRSLPEGSWAAAYCSKMHNVSHEDAPVETCQYREWTVHHFTNSTLLQLCGQTHGLREYVCLNATLYHQLLRLKPQLADVCADLQAEQEARKCFLQRFFDMLPAPYEFDTSQLCVDPATQLADVVHKLSVCEVEGGEREGFLVALGYVLRVLDFMVGLSSGLDEGEREARQGLGQAILLSSLLDNTSWSTLQPEASMSVLHTVGVFLRREQNTSLKEDLLSCFSPVLWDLIQQDDNSSALRVLLQEYLQMPRDSIRTLVMSAEKDAVKRFLSHMHQSWDQLQVETSQASQKELQAMETMTAAFIHKFPRVTPELFVDLSQFIPFMSVSDIMSFPASLIVNDSVLTAIRDHSSGMKSPQKKAFVKRLLQSSVVGDVPTWPPYFLSSILPLLPYLPVSHFQQLTSQQLTPLVELLGNSSLDGVRGRHVLRTLFGKKKNLTSDNVMRLGVLACYLDPADLGSYLQDSAVSSDLWLQLSQCMSKGFISARGRLSDWLIPTVQTLNASSMASPELSALSGLLPQLGASFLMSLPSQQLLEVLSQPGLRRYSPAQVSREGVFLFLFGFLSFFLSSSVFCGKKTCFFLQSLAVSRKCCMKLQQTQSLIRGIVKARSRRAKVPVPSCADIRGTFPSAWTPTQLNRMSQEELKKCVEVFGWDSSLSSEQRRSLWVKLKQSFGPVRELRADQLLALGSVVTEMGERELQEANLTDPGVLAHLGTLTDWSPKKTRAVILSVMRKRKLKVEQLTAVDLATFGHLICGLHPSEIKRLSPYNLSMAVLFLRDTSLPCTEQQMEALTSCLSRPEAFGPVSAWGPEVFTEIGTLAAGLPDLVLSALLQEQVEGITPEAVALMQPKKMAVVFSAVQLSWLSSEQAWAVTDEQWAELDTEQRHAVGLARYEGDVLLELRGRNSAPAALSAESLALCSLALCLLLWQLI